MYQGHTGGSCINAEPGMTHGTLGLPGEERDRIHSPHPLKENLTLGHWESLQVYNTQSSRLRSWVGGSSLPSVYPGLRCHQDVPVGSGPPPGEGAMFRTRPVRGRTEAGQLQGQQGTVGVMVGVGESQRDVLSVRRDPIVRR